MQLSLTSKNPAIALGRSDVRLTPDCDLFTRASYAVGRPIGYATVGDAMRAARILSSEAAPAIAVLGAADGPFTLSKVAYSNWSMPFGDWYAIDGTDRSVRFDQPNLRAIVDGAFAARAGVLGSYAPVVRSKS